MKLVPVPLTAEKFTEYGQVVELHSAKRFSINRGLTTRFHDLMDIDVEEKNGKPLVNVFRTNSITLPHKVKTMERHPLGSQGFYPMNSNPFLVLVGENKEMLGPDDLRLFVTNGSQGINFYKNTWHHYQLVINGPQDFLVVDRGGGGCNLEETEITDDVWIPDRI